MSDAVAERDLSRAEARSLTDEARESAEALWSLLLRLYKGKAHIALGYKSWGAYFEAEFGGHQSRGYRLLDAGRVMEQLAPAGWNGDGDPGSPLLNEAAAREIAPVLRNHGKSVAEEVLQDVVREHGQQPTASQVREAVKRHSPNGERPQPDPEPSWSARLRVLGGELQHISQHRARIEEWDMQDHVRSALNMLGDVTADLERLLLPEEP